MFLGEIGDLRLGQRQQVAGMQSNGLVVRPGVEQHEPAVEEPLVDEHTVVGPADGWDGTKLELRIGADKVFLARELDLVGAEREPRRL